MHFKYRGRGEQKRKRAGSLPAGKNLIETVKALETYFSCRHVFVCGIHTKFYWNCESCEDWFFLSACILEFLPVITKWYPAKVWWRLASPLNLPTCLFNVGLIAFGLVQRTPLKKEKRWTFLTLHIHCGLWLMHNLFGQNSGE